MPRAIPGPGDFVAPGSPVGENELKPINEQVFEKMKAELEAKERGEQAEQPEPEQPVRPGGVPRRAAPQFAPLNADPFQPIKEMGREDIHTVAFVVPDNRPFVTVPLSGPGSYVITIRRTVDPQVQG